MPAPQVALVYPPSCDPTAPYLSVPTLAAWLRREGIEVIPIDANLEAWERLLARAPLERLAAKLEQRLARLDRRPSLSHAEQLSLVALWGARGDAATVPGAIDDAVRVLRDRTGARFYDAEAYEGAVAVVEAALRLVSAAHAPLDLDFTAYRTPFSLLSAEQIALDAQPERDPFHDTFVAIAERLRAAAVSVVGLSVAFPGQVQPAYSLAHVLRAALPGVHVTVGGPAITQILQRLSGERLARAIGPFHSAVVGEGEHALVDLVRAVARGDDPCAGGRLLRGVTIEDLSTLPCPDYDGLPLDRYLAPEVVLPYDPTRGCYWGTCTFCHYGLAEVGTARYRARPVQTVAEHLGALSARWGTRIFYFSQDVFPPKLALQIARAVRERGLAVRWGSDMRPEPTLSPARCAELVEGGALAAALGVESASPRVLQLIDKGVGADDMRSVIENLSAAGIAVEAMCFSDFPTETYREALDTVRFVDSLSDRLSLFILGRFDLTHGSLVAQKPGDFGIREVWQAEGDELGTGLFWEPHRPAKRPAEHEKLEAAVAALSGRWRLHRYPWAGALSTAHTLLWYAHHGPDVFRRFGPAPDARVPGAKARVLPARFDPVAIAAVAAEREEAIWRALVHEERRVGRAEWRTRADALPHARPSPCRVRVIAGGQFERAGARRAEGPGRRGASGRRRSHAHNATKS